jgi:surface antigen
LRIHQQVWKGFQQSSRVRFVVKFGLVALLAVLFVSVSFGVNARDAHAQSFSDSPASAVGHTNVFPYGQCTWWADQRYYELHGVFVPWTTQSDAWQWTARAYQFGWHVSSSPSVGSIIDLQPWVQGAYGLGHVGVVERILSNGHVIVSNMNWGRYPWQVTYVEFTPGPGVTFIRQ